MVVGTIIKPKLGLRPELFARACYDFWLGGEFVKNDEPQGNQPFAPYVETMRLVAEALEAAQQQTGDAKLFSANITADDPWEMVARGEAVLEAFGDNAEHLAFLVDGYVGGPAAVTTARRRFPDVFLHYHRAGHGAVTSPSSQRGYTAFVLAKMARLQGASGIHTGTMGFGKMEGDKADKAIAYFERALAQSNNVPGLSLLARRGLAVPQSHTERDWTAGYVASTAVEQAWLAVYRDPSRYWDLYQLGEEFTDLEDAFRLWRFRHVTTVERVIGFKRGTGGTSGVGYLRKMLDTVLFPEIWKLRTDL